MNSSRKSVSQCHSPFPYNGNFKTHCTFSTNRGNQDHLKQIFTHSHKNNIHTNPFIASKLGNNAINSRDRKSNLKKFIETGLSKDLVLDRSSRKNK